MNFVGYQKSPGIYSNWDISDAVRAMGDHKGTSKIEFDEISMRTEVFLKRLVELLDVYSFTNSINNIKEMITYSKDKNHKWKKKCKEHETLTTILKTFDTFNIFATTSSSITLSLTGSGLIVIPLSTAYMWISIDNKVKYEMVMPTYYIYQKRYDKDQQIIKSFDNLYRKCLQDNVNDKSEYESLCNIFTKYLEEKKWMIFINLNIK